MKALALLSVFLAVPACQQQPVPPPPWNPDAAAPYIDASPGSCQAACNALLAAHCPEGMPSTCLPVLQELDESRNFSGTNGRPTTCASVSFVVTPADARALGIACAGAP